MRTIYAYFHGENVRLKVAAVPISGSSIGFLSCGNVHIRPQKFINFVSRPSISFWFCISTIYWNKKQKMTNWPESAAVLTVGFLENYLRKNVFKDMLHCNLNTNCFFFFFFDQDACIVTLHSPLSYTFCASCSLFALITPYFLHSVPEVFRSSRSSFPFYYLTAQSSIQITCE